MLSIIRDNARSGGGEGAHVLLGGGGLAFLGLESSKEEEVGRARNRQGVGRLVLRAAHTTISHFFFFFFLVICRPAREKISRPWKCIFESSHVVKSTEIHVGIWQIR